MHYAQSGYGLRPAPVVAWLEIAEAYGPRLRGQFVRPIDDAIGWFRYLSKHAVRGLRHYQRSNENRPAGWEKTGRMWGYLGDWPTRESIRFEVCSCGFVILRRMARQWRIATVREDGNGRQIRAARRMLKANDPQRRQNHLRGLSEWMPENVTAQCLHWLAKTGHQVEC
jgi:hypothetical protein